MKKTHYIYISLLIISFMCMLLITTSSPLYSVNISPDSNVMFTIGKSFWNGLMPYKNLFDQRGPLIYLINSIAALISYRSFTGIYIFESLLTFLDLMFIYKILNLKFDSFISFISTLMSIPFIFNSKFLSYGNIPEEYAIPLIFITLYILAKKDLSKWNKTNFYTMGVFLAITFWIKYTLSITWIIIFISLLIFYKKYKKVGELLAFGFIGFATISFPILLIYFIKESLGQLMYVYFYLNITAYHKPNHIISITFISLIIIGITFIVLFSKTFKLDKSRILIISLITFITFLVQFYTFSGSNYYYFLTEYSFIIFPIIICCIYRFIKFKYVFIVIFILFLPLLFITNKNYKSSTILQPRNQYVDFYGHKNVPIQYEFNNLIKQTQNYKLLNYRNLDLGFYTYSGSIPSQKYFIWNNMNYSPMQKNQNEYLTSLKYNFIIIRYDSYPDIANKQKLSPNIIKTLKSKYYILRKRVVLFEGVKQTYIIYKKA